MTPEQVAESHEARINDAAERVHALLLVAQGTVSCPSIKEIRDSIRFVLTEATNRIQDTALFAIPGGCYIQIEQNKRNWDYFQVLVPATPRFTWLHPAGED